MKSIIIGVGRRGAYEYQNEWFENGHIKVQRNDRDVGINKILSTPGTKVYMQVDGVVSAEYRVIDWNPLAWLVTPVSDLKSPVRTGMQRSSYNTLKLEELNQAERK